jgi:hypothetical protein
LGMPERRPRHVLGARVNLPSAIEGVERKTEPQIALRKSAAETDSNHAGSILADLAALTLQSGEEDALMMFLTQEGVAHMVSRPVLPASAAASRCATLGPV